jgi:hypothetical protein
MLNSIEFSEKQPQKLSKQEKAIVWEMHYKDWQRSGKSQKQFCQNRKLNYHVFKYWLTIFNKNNHLKTLISFLIISDAIKN